MVFFKVVVNAPNNDQIVEVKYKGTIVKMRVLKFELNSRIIETLITNIFDENFTVANFKELYFKRWAIEVKYNEIKKQVTSGIVIPQSHFAQICGNNQTMRLPQLVYYRFKFFRGVPQTVLAATARQYNLGFGADRRE